MKQITFLVALLGLAFSSSGQFLVVPRDVRFNIDSVTKDHLFESLNHFLDQKEHRNKENTYVFKSDLPAMSALLDEIKGIEKNTKLKDDHFYKPFVENIVDAGDNNFLIQLNYMGYAEGLPIVRASFRLMAKKDSNRFYFYSVLKQNTDFWKTKKISYITFHFKDTIYNAETRAYIKYVTLYNQKLNVNTEPIDFYLCDNFYEAAQILGIDYKADYSGMLYNDFTSHENHTTLEINGRYTATSLFDRHDLWHDRLHMVLSTDKINRPVDEGCAYLYGGSWGMPWPEVLAIFKKYAVEHPDADWLKLYQGNIRFNADAKRPFYISYFINALMVQKIEKEKGFAPVIELLGCGKREAAEDNYFKALQKVSGISRADFNKTVWDLLKAEPN
jgi:hypothetical protein